MTSILYTKPEDEGKTKESDDQKGAIPKGFEKFYKKGSKKEGEDKPSGTTPKDEKTAKGEEKKQKEEGQKSDDEEPTEAPDREKATKPHGAGA